MRDRASWAPDKTGSANQPRQADGRRRRATIMAPVPGAPKPAGVDGPQRWILVGPLPERAQLASSRGEEYSIIRLADAPDETGNGDGDHVAPWLEAACILSSAMVNHDHTHRNADRHAVQLLVLLHGDAEEYEHPAGDQEDRDRRRWIGRLDDGDDPGERADHEGRRDRGDRVARGGDHRRG